MNLAPASIEGEIQPGERVLWSGQPHLEPLLSPEHVYLIPIAMLNVCTAVLWGIIVLDDSGATLSDFPHRVPDLPILLSIVGPFLLNCYIFFGHFFHTRWANRRTCYAITDRRVIIAIKSLTGLTVWAQDVSSIPVLERRLRENNTGTIGLGVRDASRQPLTYVSFCTLATRAFVDIPEIDEVYQTLRKLRAAGPLDLRPSAADPEVCMDERVLWSGQPRLDVNFGPDDVYNIPLSLFLGAFCIYWGANMYKMVTGDIARGITTRFHHGPFFYLSFAIPPLCLFIYAFAGRFVHARWLKARTRYVVTDKRILIVRNGRAKRAIWEQDVRFLTHVECRARKSGTGTISFVAPIKEARQEIPWKSSKLSAPAFVDIPEVEKVYRLVERARGHSS